MHLVALQERPLRLHATLLEKGRFAEPVFCPTRVTGHVPWAVRGARQPRRLRPLKTGIHSACDRIQRILPGNQDGIYCNRRSAARHSAGSAEPADPDL